MVFSLEEYLISRMQYMEHYVKQGIIPGELDSVELTEMRGRIKELKFLLAMLNENCTTPVVRAQSEVVSSDI